MIFLPDEEVELFGTIHGNIMIYNGKEHKIVQVTTDGYYVFEIKKGP